ncbi:MAG: ubiquitin-conjugating enzyme family protein [Planctomycetota bacterium]|jgi:hypothetical protein
MDHIFRSFLERNYEMGMALARDSDLLELTPVAGNPPHKYAAEYFCKGLVRDAGGHISEADRFLVGIYFPENYLRVADPYTVLTWCEPDEIFHSNAKPPLICLDLAPGKPLVPLLHGCYEIITWQLYATDDALSKEAAEWGRHNARRLPIDRRPLKRRAIDVRVEKVEAGA